MVVVVATRSRLSSYRRFSSINQREPRCATAYASRTWRGSGNPVFRLRQAQNVARTEKRGARKICGISQPET